MRVVVAWMFVLVAGVAQAQEVGQTVELVAQTSSVRFVGERAPGPEFNEGQRVVVVAVEGAQVRVFAGDRYGWVPAASVRPPVEAPPPIQIQLGE